MKRKFKKIFFELFKGKPNLKFGVLFLKFASLVQKLWTKNENINFKKCQKRRKMRVSIYQKDVTSFINLSKITFPSKALFMFYLFIYRFLYISLCNLTSSHGYHQGTR